MGVCLEPVDCLLTPVLGGCSGTALLWPPAALCCWWSTSRLEPRLLSWLPLWRLLLLQGSPVPAPW